MIPCENCIVYAICKQRVEAGVNSFITRAFRLHVYSTLVIRCSIIRNYINHQPPSEPTKSVTYDGDKFNEICDYYKIGEKYASM